MELVDEFTGRVVRDRRWPDGLQAAVEAKEGVPLKPQGAIRGSITLQHFLRLYPKTAGMTATARPAADELFEFYDMSVVVIPPNRKCIDPGSSRFYVSLQDDLVKRFGIRDLIPPQYRTLRQDEPIDDPAFTRVIGRAQRTIEEQTFEIRRTLWRYASFIEHQRQAVQRRRQAILKDEVTLDLLVTRAEDR